MSFPTVDDQLAIIKRGAVEIVPEEELIEKLKNRVKRIRRFELNSDATPPAPTFTLATL